MIQSGYGTVPSQGFLEFPILATPTLHFKPFFLPDVKLIGEETIDDPFATEMFSTKVKQPTEKY